MISGEVRKIGTAGWSIPRAIGHEFPAGESLLQRYARVFDCVEINSSFYKPHQRTTYERWAGSVPDGFRFAAKLPRTITHEKRLVLADGALHRFLNEFAGLGAKCGPILIQLPPSLAFDAGLAATFFATMRAETSAALVCEPRHPTWFGDDADALLRDFRVARVAADPARVPAAAVWGGWPALRYLRMHGSPKIYYSGYGPNRLATIAQGLADAPCETWCIFDNTASGAASADALHLRDALR